MTCGLNFRKNLGLGLYGNNFSHTVTLRQNFPAPLSVRDPRMTRSTPRLFEDLHEGDEVEIEPL